MTDKYVIVDLRPEWSRNPYITFWRPNFAGYAYPLSWAGQYDQSTVIKEGRYLTTRRYSPKHGTHSGRWERFAVLAEVAEKISVAPCPGIIDDDAGPVIPNTLPNRHILTRARFKLPQRQGGAS